MFSIITPPGNKDGRMANATSVSYNTLQKSVNIWMYLVLVFLGLQQLQNYLNSQEINKQDYVGKHIPKNKENMVKDQCLELGLKIYTSSPMCRRL